VKSERNPASVFLPVRCTSIHILVPINSSNMAKSFFPAALFMAFASCSYCYSTFFAIMLISKCVMKKHSVMKFGAGMSKLEEDIWLDFSSSRLEWEVSSTVMPLTGS
jgi:hypothetical protein